MQKKILVVGSGDNTELDVSSFDMVYAANSSFTHLRDPKRLILVLSDAMLFSLEDLNKHAPIPNMARPASNEFRMRKYGIIDGLDFDRVIIIDNKNIDIELALKRKKLSIKSITKLDHKAIWKLIHKCFTYYELITVVTYIKGLSNKFRFLAQRLLNKKMSVSFRPSTGINAIMMAFYENPSAKIYTTGINVHGDFGLRRAIYSTGEFTYKDDIHLLDPLYCKFFLKKGVRILNEYN